MTTLPFLTDLLAATGQAVLTVLRTTGQLTFFAANAVSHLVRPPW